MSEHIASADGTRIAYDMGGTGPLVIMVAAAMQFRAFDPATVALAGELAARGFTVINYDRRGRGDSPATEFGLKRELEDIQALIDANGGSAALFGSSSGGAIALAAAASGLPVTKLALWEVPLGAELGTDGADFLAGLRERIATGDGGATMEYYMKDMPAEWLAGAKSSPGWPIMTAMSPSLEGDAEALAWSQSAPHAELLARVDAPVLAMVGRETLPIMPVAASAISSGVADGRVVAVDGANHGWQLDAMAETLSAFLRE